MIIDDTADSGARPNSGSAEAGADTANDAANLAESRGALEEIERGMQNLGAFIREQRRQARLSLRKLSDQAGISNPYLSQIERGLRKPSASILQQIARALRISAESLYVQAGILEEQTDGTDLAAAILRDTNLTEAQKQSLCSIYQAFRAENLATRQAALDAAGTSRTHLDD